MFRLDKGAFAEVPLSGDHEQEDLFALKPHHFEAVRARGISFL
jgi:hypothetical protein